MMTTKVTNQGLSDSRYSRLLNARAYARRKGRKPLSPEQQAWIRQLIKSYDYEWEVTFDSFYEDYEYHHLKLLNHR